MGEGWSIHGGPVLRIHMASPRTPDDELPELPPLDGEDEDAPRDAEEEGEDEAEEGVGLDDEEAGGQDDELDAGDEEERWLEGSEPEAKEEDDDLDDPGEEGWVGGAVSLDCAARTWVMASKEQHAQRSVMNPS